MGVLADLYLSRDDEEAVRYDSEPETFKDREQYRNFAELELSTLWAKIRGIEWDVNSLDEFHSVCERWRRTLHQTLAHFYDRRTCTFDPGANLDCFRPLGSH